MTVTPASFRTAFAEFGDAAKYPDASVNVWLTLSTKMMNSERWGELIDHGAMLFVAHRLTIQAKARRDAEFGKTPGMATGIVTSKGVDKVNISYDVSSVAEEGAGHWNLTTYGQEYIRLARMMGAGPVHVGAPSADESSSLYAGFYAGPYLG